MNPSQLGEKLQINPKDIRKFARTAFPKPEGKWNFNSLQTERIIKHFQNQAPQATQSVAAPPKTQSGVITLSEMKEIANTFLQEKYGMELGIPITINTRIKKALGRFRSRNSTRTPVGIEIGSDLINYHSRLTAIDVLKHELIHYAVFSLGKPHKDGDAYFENELKKHGVARTHTYQVRGERHQYKCSKCNQTVATTSRRINVNNKISGCCRNHIIYIGKVIV